MSAQQCKNTIHVLCIPDRPTIQYNCLSCNRMRNVGLLALLIYLIGILYSSGENTTTTNEAQYEIKLDDLVLLDTLAYIKSGNINALSWSLRYQQTASNTTQLHNHYPATYFVIVAASVTTFQVWNGTTITTSSNNKNDTNSSSDSIINWGIVQLIPSSNVAHAVAFSPNGKWLALGKYYWN